MGPEEYASREELGVLVKFLVAKIGQQAVAIAMLNDLLIGRGIITDADVVALALKVQNSPQAERCRQAEEQMNQFAAIRNIAKRYVDPQEE